MAKIQLLTVAFATLSVLFCNAADLDHPGPKEKFKINTVEIEGTPNEYFEFASIRPNPDHMSSVTEVVIAKTLPENLELEVNLKYQGQELPPVVFPVCPGMSDPVFVNDVVTKGEPKETFPHECPINPGRFRVVDWDFPHYKIPPGTLPGSVDVDVKLKTGEQTIFRLISTGEVVVDMGDAAKMAKVPEVPKMPLGK